MRINLLSSSKLAVAKLYQLTKDQRIILLDTLKQETEPGQIHPSNAAYGSPMFFVTKRGNNPQRLSTSFDQSDQSYPRPNTSPSLTLLGPINYCVLLKAMNTSQPFNSVLEYGMYESLVVWDGL